jgi:hypothetical protein
VPVPRGPLFLPGQVTAVRWVPGVSIGDEGGTFWPWHRNREDYFTIGHYRIGAAVVLCCKDCGVILASPVRTKRRKDAGIKAHDNLHQQVYELQEQVDYLYEALQIERDDDDDDDTTGTESGYLESGYEVRELGSAADSDDD